MNRREFLAGTSAVAIAVAMPMPMPALADAEIIERGFACEACNGMGWSRARNHPDCKWCQGTGVMSWDEANAFWDRFS